MKVGISGLLRKPTVCRIMTVFATRNALEVKRLIKDAKCRTPKAVRAGCHMATASEEMENAGTKVCSTICAARSCQRVSDYYLLYVYSSMANQRREQRRFASERPKQVLRNQFNSVRPFQPRRV